ncbi:MAG: RNA polymerase sigma factor [Vicinamibacterales bacterium]
MHPDDRAVVAQAKSGDQAAFRLLVERHSRSIYRIAFRITGRHEDAEDMVQETFVRAYRQLDRFEARSNFGTWLYRIGFNCAIDYARSRRNRETPSDPLTIDQRAADSGQPSTDDMVYAGQIHARVEQALGRLTEQERTAFVMRHYHECPIDEISEALGVKTNAAKHAVFRAVKKMRVALRPLLARAPHSSTSTL